MNRKLKQSQQDSRLHVLNGGDIGLCLWSGRCSTQSLFMGLPYDFNRASGVHNQLDFRMALFGSELESRRLYGDSHPLYLRLPNYTLVRRRVVVSMWARSTDIFVRMYLSVTCKAKVFLVYQIFIRSHSSLHIDIHLHHDFQVRSSPPVTRRSG